MHDMEEEKRHGGVVNHFEKDSNCQVFNGNVTGCVFAMPGSTVTLQPLPPAAGESDEQSPNIELLRRLVSEADASKPKQVLMPYKAALSISAVPRWDYSTFNRLMGTNVTRNSFSNWINETQGCTYTDEEIDPIVEQFKKLM